MAVREYYDVYWNMLSKHLPRTSRHSLCVRTEEGERTAIVHLFFSQYLFMMVGGLEARGWWGFRRWGGSVRKDRLIS